MREGGRDGGGGRERERERVRSVKIDSFFLKINNSESVYMSAFLSPELGLEGGMEFKKTNLNECMTLE